MKLSTRLLPTNFDPNVDVPKSPAQLHDELRQACAKTGLGNVTVASRPRFTRRGVASIVIAVLAFAAAGWMASGFGPMPYDVRSVEVAK